MLARLLSLATARWLLVAHAVLAFAAVASCTHWCVYLYPFARGRYVRVQAARRFGMRWKSALGFMQATGW